MNLELWKKDMIRAKAIFDREQAVLDGMLRMTVIDRDIVDKQKKIRDQKFASYENLREIYFTEKQKQKKAN